VQYRT